MLLDAFNPRKKVSMQMWKLEQAVLLSWKTNAQTLATQYTLEQTVKHFYRKAFREEAVIYL